MGPAIINDDDTDDPSSHASHSTGPIRTHAQHCSANCHVHLINSIITKAPLPTTSFPALDHVASTRALLKTCTASSKIPTPHPLPNPSISLAPLLTTSQVTFSNIVISSSQRNTAQSDKQVLPMNLVASSKAYATSRVRTLVYSFITNRYLNTSTQHRNALSAIIDHKKRNHITHDSPSVATASHMMATRALQWPISSPPNSSSIPPFPLPTQNSTAWTSQSSTS